MTKKLQTVYYNLKESPYSILVNGIEYFFSSQFNKDRFVNKVKESRKEMRNSFLIKKYPLTEKIAGRYDLSGMADLNLYLIVENKGFCIKLEGKIVSCQTLLDSILQNAIRNCFQKSTVR